jgi:AraC-like DNA-binding protein
VAKFHLLLQGQAWLVLDDREPSLVSAGELVILPYGHLHAMKDQPGSPVEALDRILLDSPLDDRARLYYGGDGAMTRMLCGGFGLQDPIQRLLPRVVRVDTRGNRVGSWIEAIFQLLQAEAAESLPGAKEIFARISDVFLAQALRAFLAALPGTGAPTAEALTDPQIAQAVHLIHTQPAHGWSVGQLAYRVGISRSAFNDRFRDLVGEPPMRYLTQTRLTQAAGYLATSDRTLQEIAKLCGYDTDAALSKAFKREYGMSPGEYRTSRRPPIELVTPASG